MHPKDKVAAGCKPDKLSEVLCLSRSHLFWRFIVSTLKQVIWVRVSYVLGHMTCFSPQITIHPVASHVHVLSEEFFLWILHVMIDWAHIEPYDRLPFRYIIEQGIESNEFFPCSTHDTHWQSLCPTDVAQRWWKLVSKICVLLLITDLAGNENSKHSEPLQIWWHCEGLGWLLQNHFWQERVENSVSSTERKVRKQRW